MPVVIGAKRESNFEDPIGLLNDCHRRIERFLSVLVEMAGRAPDGPLNGEQRTALENALRYFREAAPRHTADEEQSLFPRMRRTPAAATALEQVARLEDDHACAEQCHAEVDRLGRAWLAEGTLNPPDRTRLSAVLAELAALYRQHIEVEEREVFPLAARVLAAVDHQAIGAEMAARRGLPTASR